MANNSILRNYDIDLIKAGLKLRPLSSSMTLGEIVDNINLNFSEINENGGGPKGEPGIQGAAGCRGIPGVQGPSGDDGNWVGLDPKFCSDELNQNKIISDKSPLSKLILSDYALDTLGNKVIPKFGDIYEKLDNYPVLANEHKLQVCQENGNNIALIDTDQDIDDLCLIKGSSFSQVNQLNQSTMLKIGKLNPDASHNHTTHIGTNKLSLSQTGLHNEQILSFKTEIGSYSEMIVGLDNVTNTDKYIHIPDRSGYHAIWQTNQEKTTNLYPEDELWDYYSATNDNLKILNLKYSIGDTSYTLPSDVPELDKYPVILDSTSYIRFKQMNNFVLIDFNFVLSKNPEFFKLLENTNLTIRYFTVLLNTNSILCQTNSWATSSAMETQEIDEDISDISMYGFFKVFSEKTDTMETFKITNKFPISNYNLSYTSEIETLYNLYSDVYYISGQKWATIKGIDDVCEFVYIKEKLCDPIVINEVVGGGTGSNTGSGGGSTGNGSGELPCPTITPIINGTTYTVFKGSPLTFTTDVGFSDYLWAADGGTITLNGESSVTITWDTVGTKTISVGYMKDGCPSVRTEKSVGVLSNCVTPNQTIVGYDAPQRVVVGESLSLSTDSGFDTYLWVANDDGVVTTDTTKDVTVTWATVGSHKVSVKCTSGTCFNTKEITVLVTAAGNGTIVTNSYTTSGFISDVLGTDGYSTTMQYITPPDTDNDVPVFTSIIDSYTTVGVRALRNKLTNSVSSTVNGWVTYNWKCYSTLDAAQNDGTEISNWKNDYDGSVLGDTTNSLKFGAAVTNGNGEFIPSWAIDDTRYFVCISTYEDVTLRSSVFSVTRVAHTI